MKNSGKDPAVKFPVVEGDNLLRRRLTLPNDLDGEVNILLIAIYQWHQRKIDTWLPFAKSLEQFHEGVRYYELPVIRRMNVLARTFINEGMRAGIPNPTARERTITLYVDKAVFRQALAMPHEEDIYVLLVDGGGDVLWRTEGAFTPEKGESLAMAIQTIGDEVYHAETERVV